MNQKIAAVLLLLACASSARAATVTTLGDIDFFVGSGANTAALVVDWRDGRDPLSWGYRFDGSRTGEDMVRAIAAADPRLVTAFSVFGFGNLLFNFGYDRDADGFIVAGRSDVDGVTEATGGPAPPSAIDPDDSFADGTFPPTWAYYVSDDDPFAGGDPFAFANEGFSTRTLTDGSWDGWTFDTTGSVFFVPGATAAFVPDVPQAAPAPVPEPTTMLIAAFGAAGVAIGRRRRR